MRSRIQFASKPNRLFSSSFVTTLSGTKDPVPRICTPVSEAVLWLVKTCWRCGSWLSVTGGLNSVGAARLHRAVSGRDRRQVERPQMARRTRPFGQYPVNPPQACRYSTLVCNAAQCTREIRVKPARDSSGDALQNKKRRSLLTDFAVHEFVMPQSDHFASLRCFSKSPIGMI